MGTFLQTLTGVPGQLIDHFYTHYCHYTAYMCGHETRLTGTLAAYGETRTLTLIPREDRIFYCFDCLVEQVVLCAKCGKPVFPYDIVGFCFPQKDWNLQAPLYRNRNCELVCCRHPECIEDRVDSNIGIWIPRADGNIDIQGPTEPPYAKRN